MFYVRWLLSLFRFYKLYFSSLNSLFINVFTMPNLVNTRLLIKNVAAKKMIIMELYNSVTTVRKHWVVIKQLCPRFLKTFVVFEIFWEIKKNLCSSFSCILNTLRIARLKKLRVRFFNISGKKSGTIDDIYLIWSSHKNCFLNYKTAGFSIIVKISIKKIMTPW